MSQTPTVYRVKPEHVGNKDVNDFLHQCIAKEFAGKEYFIVNESLLDRTTPEFPTTFRKIKAYAIETGGQPVSLFFDVTDVTTANKTSWFGAR